ncbi:MAG TPA: hypothetical protein VJ881_10700 [Halanaerobiales bacterium]|nr:hypothetical protein [Halanaerobiales bacterium]
MKKVVSLVLVFSLLLVGISSTVSAFGYLDGQNNGDCVLEGELDLTETQVEKLMEARDNYEKVRNEIQEKIRDYNRSGEVNQGEIEELRAELETARENYMNQVEEILTEEQFAKIEQDPKLNNYQSSQDKGSGNRQGQANSKGKGQGNNQGNNKGQGNGKGNV